MKRLIAIVLLVMLFARVVNAQDQVETARVQSMYEYVIFFLAAGWSVTVVLYGLQGRSMRDMLPKQFIPIIPMTLNLLVGLAKLTPTQADDKLIADIQQKLNPPANDGGVG